MSLECSVWYSNVPFQRQPVSMWPDLLTFLDSPPSQGTAESSDTSAGQHPRGRPGEVLGLRPVLRRDQRHPAPHRGLRLQPAAGYAAPCLHPQIQHVSTAATAASILYWTTFPRNPWFCYSDASLASSDIHQVKLV